jgi:hypothetical protein
MFDLIQRWPFRTTTNRPLRFSNRVVLSFEDLETRTLLSPGVIQATVFDGPLPAVAIVAEPVNPNATSAQSQTGSPSNGTTGSAGQPALSTLVPVVNTTLDVVLTGVNAPTSLLPSPTGILPGQGTAGATRVGGQLLLSGGVTTPPTPRQQILAGIVNTADPYARFEQTILTKEGEKTASGQEVPIPPQSNNQQNPVRASGAVEEEGELDFLDPGSAG